MEAFNYTELFAVILALLYLLLATYQSLWCWVAAAISSLLFIKICFDARLYIESGLQFFYFVMALVGFWEWSRKKNNSSTQQVISDLNWNQALIGISICTLLSVAMAYFFQKNTNAMLPWVDAPVTVFSLWATWLVVQRVLQNWLFWIVIDTVAIYIYIVRDLHLTATLYALYVVLAIIGYYKWKKAKTLSLKLLL